MKIGPVSIGGNAPTRFVAELSNNHNGDLAQAHRLLDVAKASGADIAKLQCYTPDELVALRGDGPAPEPWGSEGWTMRALYEKAQTPHAWFPELVSHCNDIGLPWFSSVFGAESLALLESLDCPAYKIARLDNKIVGLADACCVTGKALVVSVEFPYDHVVVAGDVFQLYCPPGYPQSLTGALRSHFWIDAGFFAGFSYHGTDIRPPVVASTLGAKLVEAHLQLDDAPSVLEANVSLTASQFAAMVREVRLNEELLR